jgi:RNA polymerase sigma factor (sigma-70 family)
VTSATHRAINAVWRIESARVIAGLARIVRDVGIAEELAQDALVAALEQWPGSGVPRNPGAWLMAIGKRRTVDFVRRKETFARKLAEVGRELETVSAPDSDDAARSLNDDIEDDLLRLVFIACHPVLSMQTHVALTLRLLGGLTTEEIARAFLVSESTVAQRIVRAKRTSVWGDLLVKLGRCDEARGEFERAASLTRNVRERTLLLKHAAACAVPPSGAD